MPENRYAARVHLRLCLVWHAVHRAAAATARAGPPRHAPLPHQTAHPVMASFEPGERWAWCYVDEIEQPVPEEALLVPAGEEAQRVPHRSRSRFPGVDTDQWRLDRGVPVLMNCDRAAGHAWDQGDWSRWLSRRDRRIPKSDRRAESVEFEDADHRGKVLPMPSGSPYPPNGRRSSRTTRTSAGDGPADQGDRGLRQGRAQSQGRSPARARRPGKGRRRREVGRGPPTPGTRAASRSSTFADDGHSGRTPPR